MRPTRKPSVEETQRLPKQLKPQPKTASQPQICSYFYMSFYSTVYSACETCICFNFELFTNFMFVWLSLLKGVVGGCVQFYVPWTISVKSGVRYHGCTEYSSTDHASPSGTAVRYSVRASTARRGPCDHSRADRRGGSRSS